jgi:hypothetical protein
MRRSAIEVKALGRGATIRDWLSVPRLTLAGDPAWVCPLDLAERQRISPRHNPFFAFGEACFFVAYRDARPVGRISAQLNRRHLEHYGDRTGQFGFFDCVDDRSVAGQLFQAAADWMAARGLRRMQGPFNLTINQDAGLLVSGFDTRPTIMTSHCPRYTPALVEACGLTKAMDLRAYRVSSLAPVEKVVRLGKIARDSGRVRVRNIDLRRYAEEAQLLFDIFNDAWSDNWGFTAFSADEARATAAELRPFMRAKFGWIAEIDGEPAAMSIILPDLNEVIPSFGGRLLPLNWARLAYAVWNDDWHSARVPLLGVRKKYQSSPLAMGVLSLVVAELLKLSRQYGDVMVEFSWILETNRPMNAIAELAAGPPARVYRIYEKAIAPDGAGRSRATPAPE